MLLASQVAGALVGGLLVVLIARTAGLRGPRALATVVVIPVAVAAMLAAPNLREAIAHFWDQRDANSVLSTEQLRLAPGTAAGMDVDFLSWVDARMSPDDTFSAVVGDSVGEDKVELYGQWILFQLAPRLAVAPESEPDWVVFYQVPPGEYQGPEYRDVRVFAPGFALARYADAE